MTDNQTVTLPVSFETLDELVKSIESDFGCEYAIDAGLEALEQLRALLDQANPHPNNC